MRGGRGELGSVEERGRREGRKGESVKKGRKEGRGRVWKKGRKG